MISLVIHIICVLIVLVGLGLLLEPSSILGVAPSLVSLGPILALLITCSHIIVESFLVFVRKDGVSSGDGLKLVFHLTLFLL